MCKSFLNVGYSKENEKFDATIFGMNFLTTDYIDGVDKAADALRDSSQVYSNEDGTHFPLKIYNPKRGFILGNLKINDYGNVNLMDNDCMIEKAAFPVFFGSDHGATYHILKNYKFDTDFTVLQFDAHGDYLNEFKECSHGSVMRQIRTFPFVKKVVHCGLRGNLNSEIGLRNSIEDGNAIILKEDLDFDSIKKNLNKQDKVYITIDVDFFDPSLIAGTHRPEPNGFLYEDFRIMITKVFKEFDVIGFDVVEYAPQLDISMISGNLIVNLIIEMLGAKFNPDYK